MTIEALAKEAYNNLYETFQDTPNFFEQKINWEQLPGETQKLWIHFIKRIKGINLDPGSED